SPAGSAVGLGSGVGLGAWLGAASTCGEGSSGAGVFSGGVGVGPQAASATISAITIENNLGERDARGMSLIIN
ncbi:MAG TPA: hypothetical protein PJ988_16030, partial [Anaerolinea sp.]|nr:hypothetical protein [Anaerolinea sp.]